MQQKLRRSRQQKVHPYSVRRWFNDFSNCRSIGVVFLRLRRASHPFAEENVSVQVLFVHHGSNAVQAVVMWSCTALQATFMDGVFWNGYKPWLNRGQTFFIICLIMQDDWLPPIKQALLIWICKCFLTLECFAGLKNAGEQSGQWYCPWEQHVVHLSGRGKVRPLWMDTWIWNKNNTVNTLKKKQRIVLC